MTRKAVTDPAILEQLDGGRTPVSDPDVLRQLNGSDVAANIRAIDERRAAESFEEPSTFEYLFNRIKKGAAGFLGLPGDVVDATRKLRPERFNPMTAIPSMAAEAIKEKTGYGDWERSIPTERGIATSGTYRDAFGYDPNMKTGRDWLRYTGGVAEMAAAGGPFALAAKPASAIPILTSSIGAGIGQEAGGDVASGLGLSREAGEATGALAGGAASSVLPNALSLTGRFVRNRFSPDANRARAESQVGREIAGQLESYPSAARNIERSLEISNEIPGFNPSLPARSGAPGMIAEEERLIGKSKTAMNRAATHREENERAIAQYVNTKFPAVGGETASNRVNRLREMSEARLAGIRTQIDEQLDDSLRVFQANPSNYENGQRLRELLAKQKEVYAGTRSQKYQDVYRSADAAGVRANIDDVMQYADDVLKSEYNAYQQSEIPSVFRQLAKKKPGGDVPEDVAAFVEKQGGKAAGDVSFAELHSLYKRTNADLASLRGSNRVDRDMQVHLLEGLKTKLTDKIKAFEGPEFGDVAAKLKEANRFYAEEYVPRFKQGFGSDVVARYPSGEFRTPDQLVTELITKRPNNTQAAKDFKLIYGESPEAWQALRAGYLDEIYRSGGIVNAEGRINQKSLDTFLRKHEPTLAEFPQVKKELQQLALDNGALLERRAYIVKAEKELAAHDLYRLFSGRDPNVVLAEATTNPNAMRALAFQARNDPNMAKGLARGIAEHVTAQADPAAFLAANEEAIRTGLKPMGREHFENLKTVVDAMTINSRVQMPSTVAVSGDSFADKVGSSPRAIVSHMLNAERGRTGYTQEGAAFVGRWFDKLRRDHKLVAMEAIFYDKDAARALANLAKNPQGQKARLDFATQMTALGVRAEVAGQE